MKFEVVQCPQCGETFKRTNPRKEYCTGACRVAAHRDRHGYQKPIFDKEQARLVEQIAQIPLEDFEQLVQDAIRYRTFLRLQKEEHLLSFKTGLTLFNQVFEKIEEEEDDGGRLYSRASDSVKFTQPITELLEYTEQNSINFFKEEILLKDGDKWV